MKYVYAFEEGGKEQKFLLGGKGANLAEMTKLGLPVPPGFTITHRRVQGVHGGRRPAPRRPAWTRSPQALAALEAKMGKQLGDDADPLLVSVRSGAPFSMPGMMDTVLNLGSQRRLGRRASPSRPATSASRTTRTAASCRCSARSCSTSPATTFEEALHELLRGARRRGRHRPHRPTTSRAWSTTFKGIVRERGGRRRSRTTRTSSSATRSRPCSSRGTASGRASTGAWRGSPTTSAPRSTCRRWCSATRATTPVPASRSRATRRPARASAYGDFLTNAQGEDVVAGIRITEPLDAMAQRVPRVPPAAARGDAHARAALPRHVRHRVHDRAGPALHPPDPRRQAHRRGRAAHGGRDGGRGPHRPARGGAARRSPRSSTSSCTRSSTRRRSTRRVDQGPERVAGRGRRQGVLHRRRRRGRRRAGRGRHPRAARDVARRPARHDRGGGHPHVARRAREPRRRRRPRHGHARGLRRVRASRSTSRRRQFDGTATR